MGCDGVGWHEQRAAGMTWDESGSDEMELDELT